MNGLIWGIVALRSAALALAIAGDTRTSERLYALADLAEAGKATDEHMARVAEVLKAREITIADLDDAISRIEADSARLQGA